MKIYAQHGSLAGEKVLDGFEKELLDGVIYSPRDIGGDNLKKALGIIKNKYRKADRLFDPQYYTCMLAVGDDVRLGYLPEDYTSYFAPRRRPDLTKEATIKDDIKKALSFQKSLEVTHLIAPNILLSKSFDSREASIAIDFLSLADECYKGIKDKRPLLLTIAVSRDALLDRKAMAEFMDEITGLGLTAHGIYLLVAANNSESRLDILHSDVVSAWMYFNYTLSMNGFEVVNGYSDILAPLLCAAGGSASATGWWSNLRTFSLGKFGASSGGGRLPTQRYLSQALWNRITFPELDRIRKFDPTILNGLPSDDLYDESLGSEPQRNKEVLQSWDALRAMLASVSTGSLEEKLDKCRIQIKDAEALYAQLQVSIQFEPKSNSEHLPALGDGIRLFEEIAELGSSPE
jgi:hypothetical protein